MTEGQIFQRGYRIRILSRLSSGENDGGWENTGLGLEAIIEYSSIENPKQFSNDTCHFNGVCYGILIFREDGTKHTVRWFEEKFLELICCNEVKGEKILKENSSWA